jgi:hypothetical protein
MSNIRFAYFFLVFVFACTSSHTVFAQSTQGNPPSSFPHQSPPQYSRPQRPVQGYTVQQQAPTSSQVTRPEVPVALSPKQGWNDLEKANIPEDAALWKRVLIWPVNRVRDVFDIGVETVDAILGIFGVDITGDDLSP